MDLKAAHVVADIRQGEVFGCIPHGRGAYRERVFFTMGLSPLYLGYCHLNVLEGSVK